MNTEELLSVIASQEEIIQEQAAQNKRLVELLHLLGNNEAENSASFK